MPDNIFGNDFALGGGGGGGTTDNVARTRATNALSAAATNTASITTLTTDVDGSVKSGAITANTLTLTRNNDTTQNITIAISSLRLHDATNTAYNQNDIVIGRTDPNGVFQFFEALQNIPAGTPLTNSAWSILSFDDTEGLTEADVERLITDGLPNDVEPFALIANTAARIPLARLATEVINAFIGNAGTYQSSAVYVESNIVRTGGTTDYYIVHNAMLANNNAPSDDPAFGWRLLTSGAVMGGQQLTPEQLDSITLIRTAQEILNNVVIYGTQPSIVSALNNLNSRINSVGMISGGAANPDEFIGVRRLANQLVFDQLDGTTESVIITGGETVRVLTIATTVTWTNDKSNRRFDEDSILSFSALEILVANNDVTDQFTINSYDILILQEDEAGVPIPGTGTVVTTPVDFSAFTFPFATDLRAANFQIIISVDATHIADNTAYENVSVVRRAYIYTPFASFRSARTSVPVDAFTFTELLSESGAWVSENNYLDVPRVRIDGEESQLINIMAATTPLPFTYILMPEGIVTTAGWEDSSSNHGVVYTVTPTDYDTSTTVIDGQAYEVFRFANVTNDRDIRNANEVRTPSRLLFNPFITIDGIRTPTGDGQAVNKSYADGLVNGLPTSQGLISGGVDCETYFIAQNNSTIRVIGSATQLQESTGIRFDFKCPLDNVLPTTANVIRLDGAAVAISDFARVNNHHIKIRAMFSSADANSIYQTFVQGNDPKVVSVELATGNIVNSSTILTTTTVLYNFG